MKIEARRTLKSLKIVKIDRTSLLEDCKQLPKMAVIVPTPKKTLYLCAKQRKPSRMWVVRE
jgi:hypothetical protein